MIPNHEVYEEHEAKQLDNSVKYVFSKISFVRFVAFVVE